MCARAKQGMALSGAVVFSPSCPNLPSACGSCLPLPSCPDKATGQPVPLPRVGAVTARSHLLLVLRVSVSGSLVVRLLLAQLCWGTAGCWGAEHEEGRGKVPLGCWAQQEPALPLLSQTFYAVSFLMVVVYAYEAYRTVHGWRARHMAALQVSGHQPWCGWASSFAHAAVLALRGRGEQRGDPRAAPFPEVLVACPASQQSRARASSCCETRSLGSWGVSSLQERSGCLESAWQGLPYVLAWYVPAAGPEPLSTLSQAAAWCPPSQLCPGRDGCAHLHLSLQGWCRHSRSWDSSSPVAPP